MIRKTVLVTGSSRGIGLAIAAMFAAMDYNVALNCRKSIVELNAAAEKLSAMNPHIAAIPADVSDYEQARHMFDVIRMFFDGVDVLVNNAGVSHVGLFQDMDPAQWQSVLHTNLNGALHCTHLALPYMLRQKSGVILNISSVWGQAGASCEAVYAASKAGLNSFTKSLAKELGPSGIRVNAIACGAIDTEMNRWLTGTEKTALEEQIPLMRFGGADEVARLAYFLCSEQAGYITGQIIGVDGGWL